MTSPIQVARTEGSVVPAEDRAGPKVRRVYLATDPSTGRVRLTTTKPPPSRERFLVAHDGGRALSTTGPNARRAVLAGGRVLL